MIRFTLYKCCLFAPSGPKFHSCIFGSSHDDDLLGSIDPWPKKLPSGPWIFDALRIVNSPIRSSVVSIGFKVSLDTRD